MRSQTSPTTGLPTAIRLEQIPRGILFKWFMMAFLAGNVNAGGFMACERFVTHVTGFATLFGVQVANGRWLGAIGLLSVPAYFLVGCMIAAYFIDASILKGRQPRFGLVMLIVATILAVAAFAGHYGKFGAFGTGFVLERDYFLLVLLCAASGVQNAAITTASRGLMRCTHMTGLTTDLGIGLVRALCSGGHRQLRQRELYRNWFRLGAIVAFVVGSVVGAMSFVTIDYLGFLLPAVIAIYCGNLGARAFAATAGAGEGTPKTTEGEADDATRVS